MNKEKLLHLEIIAKQMGLDVTIQSNKPLRKAVVRRSKTAP